MGSVADRLVANLEKYLEDNQDVPVNRHDYNDERELPLVVVEIGGIEQTVAGLRGNYTIDGSVSYIAVGYDDSDNSDQDSVVGTLESLLMDQVAIKAACNDAGRAAENIHLYAFFLRGMSTEQDGHANIVSLEFEAIVRACD